MYQVKDNTITRLRKSCPRCGPSYYMAEHANRFS
ncbi:MAG: 30S ribosomal protein S27ae, partial [Candidatus Ranarchaeia archaeon]